MKVLLADAGDAARLAGALAAEPGLILLHRRLDPSLAETVRAAAPDILVLALAGSDQGVLDLLQQLVATPCPIALFIASDAPAFMQRAIDAGVSFYAVLGRNMPEMAPILRATMALFRRQRAADTARAAAETLLAERTTIDRAKLSLMKHRGLSEANAYRWLRRQAMNRARRIADIAAAVLAEEPG